MKQLTAAKTICAALAALSLTGCGAITKVSANSARQTYQAVFLDTGQIFYGHLQGLGTEYPVMNDAFYLRTESNRASGQASTVLIKRGQEWHQPDRMTFNAHHILYVEPVGDGSEVAKLIAQAKR